MRARLWIWMVACLLCLAGAWLFWRETVNSRTKPAALSQAATATAPAASSASAAANILATSSTNRVASCKTNPFAYRLSNTAKSIDQLMGDRHAILLANAFIDTSEPLNLSIPAHLRSQGDPGAYIVQARGPIDATFRALLARSGAEIVAYIPNDAYLVRAQAGVANGLAANPLTQAVIPYEPYYKIQAALLTPATGQMDLPDGAALNLGLFPGDLQTSVSEIEKLGGKIVSQGSSPFGPVVQVLPPRNWTVLATLPAVQFVEPYRKRIPANDLSRVATGVSTDSLTSSNYLGLSGKNVMVEVNDSGIDASHPDLTPARVFGAPLTDTSGHGTHVAGIIAGDGTKSTTVNNASGSILSNGGYGTNSQFRGKAPLAHLLSEDFNQSDEALQMAAAQTNALISNNSWNYPVAAYDLAAASYDAAVRDALPLVTGSQPVLFVFAAGNAGNGDDSHDPGGGTPDTILSPATAKNVITVGALQEFRNITNVVMTIATDGTTNYSEPWQPETSTSYRVAGFSSRGNVGIGVEGVYGRYKPDVVAPGTFVISTRSAQWDVERYFYINPTNHDVNGFGNLVVQPGALWANVFPIVPDNAVQAAIYVVPNADSPVPFPDLGIYFGLASSVAYSYSTFNNQVLIPPDGGLTIADILNSQTFYGFNYAVSNSTTAPISFNVFTDVVTTNNPGDYFLVLSNLNQSIGTYNTASTPAPTGGPWYRYESGTSMSAAGVSGVLALMQDYFTNTLGATPSPALMKALVINGARATGFYNFHPENSINYEGWGVINLSNSLPAGVTANLFAAGASMMMIDQNPAAALATGDSHTYTITLNTNGVALPLRITLAWTDPPGDPAAAIKLVNDLNLVVTNLDDPSKTTVYYGNDIPASSIYNSAENATNPPVYDSLNNVENVYLQPGSGSNFTITVKGYRVNVNAVTAQTNNVVQDFALVISSGNGEVTNTFTVADNGIIYNPVAGQQVTGVITNNVPLLNQLVGASSPLLGTNQIPLGPNLVWGGTNGLVTIGMTNQWHFFTVTNTSGYTNAAFVTFIADTLSIPRMGVFADSVGNATRPEADIDLYVTTDPTLLNLNPVTISNCVNGPQVGLSVGGVFNGASLSRGGTEYVVDTNSDASGIHQVYYVGVYAEDQEASEFGFIPIFSRQPFSQMNPNGSQTVNGVPLPVSIPDGTPARPGHGYVFGIALYDMPVLQVVVTNTIVHQNFGDLIGTLAHGGGNGLSKTTVLNNHVSLGNPPGPYTLIYDDSGFGNITGSQPTSGPGSLNRYTGDQGNGVWLLTETDDSLTQVGSVIGYNLLIVPHQDATKGGAGGTVGPLGWLYDYIDVPAGATSLTIAATNLTGTGLLDLYVNFGSIPILTNSDFGPAGLTNGTPPGNSVTLNAPPQGRYWYGLYNNSVLPQQFYLIANIAVGTLPGESIYTSAGAVPLLDDAVTTDSIFVPANQVISSMEAGLRVDHPRVSDLVFHLISPRGTRVLLVENRGALTPDGMGATLSVTNIIPVTSSGGPAAATNVVNLAVASGTLTIYYNFYSVPDELVVYDQGGALIFDSGLISGSGVFNVAYNNSSFVTIIMNPGGNPTPSDLWDYTVSSVTQGQISYLVLTEDTNKSTTPIKFGPPPFVPGIPALAANTPPWHGSFEGAGNAANVTGYFGGGWHVDSGNIDALTPIAFGSDPDEGTNYIDLDGSNPGTISTNIPTVPGKNYTLAFTYAQNEDGKLFGHPTAFAQALQNGNPLLSVTVTQTNGWANLGWSTTSVVFTATSNLTTITFQSLDPSGDAFGVLLDCIDLTSDLNDGFENTIAGNYVRATNTAGVNPGFGGWAVTTNQVTVISNAALAFQGTNLLALADGQISRILPTIPGTTYTLSFAYRGPSATALWRGESNGVESVNANDFTQLGGVGFANAEVGQGFYFDNGVHRVTAPDAPALNVGTNDFSVDTWIQSFPAPGNWQPGNPIETIFDKRVAPNSITQLGYEMDLPSGYLNLQMADTLAPFSWHNFTANQPGDPYLEDGQWHHVAATVVRNSTTGVNLYVDGQLVFVGDPTVCPGSLVNSGPFRLGNHADVTDNLYTYFNGTIDELTLYDRALSASEVKAIYQNGSAGKYNTNAPSIGQGLAEAQVTLNGTNQPIFFGNDTNWQVATISFVATQTNTPLVMTGIEPGMLLDNFVMTSIPTNNYDLYYLPEQSLDLLKGENALGQWQLEVQDDRVGALSPTPSLLSWQLRFNFPYTPPTITTLTNTQVATNFIPPYGIAYYLVEVPTNADISTNILLNTTGPLNLLFGYPNPPTGILPPDYLILSTPITISNLAVLTTLSTPTNFAAGGTYYLGVQNLNAFAVNYGIVVNFHLVPPPLALPQLPELLAIALQPFTVTNSATGGVPPYTYVLTSSVTTAPVPVIDVNGVITWTPAILQAPAVYTLTNIVTDSAAQTATDIFHVLVLITNGLPPFPKAEGVGAFAIGGRGGDVYHVLNVNDSGPGSLRYGITSTFGSRTIVFDVSGAINLYSPLKITNPYFTIAGQTAPGDGITLQGLTFSAESVPGAVERAHDEIIRFLRCRPGDVYSPYFQGDSFHFLGVTDSIADHISASWSINTVLSTLLSTNVTVQWSVIAEPLDHSAHLLDNGNPGFQENGYGSALRYGHGAISYLHNLYADSFSQNPRVGDSLQLDFINNVVCNWGAAAGVSQDDAADNANGYTNYLNYRANYFIAGSNSGDPNLAFQANVPNATFTQIYQATNNIDNNPGTSFLNGINTGFGMFGGNYTPLGSPAPMPVQVAANSSALAYEQVLDFAGASVAGATAAGTPAAGTSLLRDPVDTNIVANVRNKSGQIIDFISSNSFAGAYLSTNFGVTYSGYAGAATYWVSNGFTRFVGVNPWPVLGSAPQPLDSDGDGLPDYWEITLLATGATSMNPGVPNNNHSNPDGYTDLEHYINWLAAPHALTVSNTPVAVDLHAIVGRTGNLTFGVANGTNGAVTLGTDGHTATFMPTNNYFGFASFGFSVTNLDTSFGGTNLDNGFDVTVSVMVSITNITTSSTLLTNAVPQTNMVPAGGIVYFLIDVPVNAQLATNILSAATGPLNLIFSQAGFPTGTNTGDYFLLTNSTGGTSLLSTSSMPTNIVPGGTYYLGVQNPGGVPVSFGLEVDFYPPPPIPPVPPVPPVIFITHTNIGGTNGFLLTWFAPTNELFRVEWTGNIQPPVAWNLFTNLIRYTGPVTTTNGWFSFFDDGSQTGGFGPMRFYRVLLVQSANLLALPYQPNQTINPLALLVVTNTATDSDPSATLSYGLTTSPPNGATISATGIINWTPSLAQASSTYTFTTVVTDNGVPPASATNSFTVTVGPPPVPVPIISIVYTNSGGFNGFLITWLAATNDLFRVEWTGNLGSPTTWNLFTNLIRYTGPVTTTNGWFSFFDDGSQTGGLGPMRYYRLLLTQSANVLTLPFQTNRTINPLTTMVVTNTATDSDPIATLAYGLTVAPAGATISASGIINWSPSLAQASSTNTITTVVTDNGVPPASATSSFIVIVNPPAVPISGVTFTTNGLFQLNWTAPTNYQFQVEWTTNLVSPTVWNYIPPGPPWITSTNTSFTFVDTNAPVQMKFYRLIQQYP